MKEPRPLKHGTIACYRNHKCRCAECRRAQSEYMKAYKQTNAAKLKAQRMAKEEDAKTTFRRNKAYFKDLYVEEEALWDLDTMALNEEELPAKYWRLANNED